MNRTLTLLACTLLLSACAKDGEEATTAASDSTPPAAPSGMAGAPVRAQQGVDSSNAAVQLRLDQVNELSEQAGGTQQP